MAMLMTTTAIQMMMTGQGFPAVLMLTDAISPTIMEPKARAACCQEIWPPG